MKKTILIISCSIFFIGCTMNPSKEARIQELEDKITQTTEKLNILENRVQKLEEIIENQY